MYFRRVGEWIESFYETLSRGYTPALVGVSSSFYSLSGRGETSQLRDALFSHGEPRQKGSSHLHQGNHQVTGSCNNRSYTLDKTKKPKDVTLVQWIMGETGFSRKIASRIARDFH